jgi:pimeloyl-ACP methyl ester carboxylesterase
MRCQVQDLEVFYEQRGAGRPIVMLHGFTLDHRSMLGCMEPIFRRRKGWQRIYLDLPGHGQTSGKEWIKNSDDMLEVVLSFLDKVIAGQRFAVAGLSYGGYLARGLVHKRSLWIDGLLLTVPRIVSHPQDRMLPSKTVLLKDSEFLSRLSPQDREDFEDVAILQTAAQWRRYE